MDPFRKRDCPQTETWVGWSLLEAGASALRGELIIQPEKLPRRGGGRGPWKKEGALCAPFIQLHSCF